MFISKTIRSLLAVSVLALAASAGAITAQASTVVSTVHYQAQIVLTTCSISACAGDFPPLASNRRLNLTRINCAMPRSPLATYEYGTVNLRNSSNVTLLQLFLPVDLSSTNFFLLNQAVDLQARDTQHINVHLSVANGNALSGAKCTATGTMDILQ